MRTPYSMLVTVIGFALLAGAASADGKLARVGTPGKGLGVRYVEAPDYNPADKDRTQFDCRVLVPRETHRVPGKGLTRRTKLQCPHTEQLAAGKCESHMLLGMRCTE